MKRAVWFLVLVAACRREADRAVVANGTIEVREVDVAPMVPARIVRLAVDEGEPVRTGDTLAVLTQSTTRADVAQQEARVRGVEAALREALAGARPQELERAQAELRMRQVEADRAVRDLARIRPLADSGAMSPQSLDAAQTEADAAVARRDVAAEGLELLREGTRRERVQAARAELGSARAALAATKAVAEDLVLISPVDGIVISRNAEPGEMLATGESVLTIGETASPFVRVYVPTRALPLVKNGQAATAVLDGFPDRPIPGRVVAISPEAEFTPRVALTEEERADLLFGVKVALDDTTGLVHPGLPATVRFSAGEAR
jgi:HlyD family secretion protein